MKAPVLAVRGLRKSFRTRGRGPASGAGREALGGVDLDLAPGEVLGIVGESGSGKTTLGRCVLRLTEPSAGTIELAGFDFRALRGRRLRQRRRRLGVIFQDPYASLNPRMQVTGILAEAVRCAGAVSAADVGARVSTLLERVGLEAGFGSRYPHELSGGQCQRVAIARALATDPDILVADEPTSALDVSVQAQILNLLLDLKRDSGLAMLFISHDLPVVERIADRIAVMYRGEIVESGSTKRLMAEPLHPYTQALLAAVPSVDPTYHQERTRLRIPTGRAHRSGCPLFDRCPVRQDLCETEKPSLDLLSGGHRVACHLAEDRVP